jgi:hypothetical protein
LRRGFRARSWLSHKPRHLVTDPKNAVLPELSSLPRSRRLPGDAVTGLSSNGCSTPTGPRAARNSSRHCARPSLGPCRRQRSNPDPAGKGLPSPRRGIATARLTRSPDHSAGSRHTCPTWGDARHARSCHSRREIVRRASARVRTAPHPLRFHSHFYDQDRDGTVRLDGRRRIDGDVVSGSAAPTAA